MATGFQFAGCVGFEAGRAGEILRLLPGAPGVLCLRGEDARAEPYLTRAADVRRRVGRLLAPAEFTAEGLPVASKRLNLRERVRTIEWTQTGSEFESLLLLYSAASGIFGVEQARRRLRLHPPYCVRLTLDHAHPRVYTTNRLAGGRNGRGLAQTYGPFASRMAAERYCDGVLDLFQLRRCWEDLEVSPEHPGCAYGEMKRCMAPCNTTCSAEEYGAEARMVEAFLRTRGESLLGQIGAEREQASKAMDFERAAAFHERYQKVKAVAGLADELVGPVTRLRAVVVQPLAEAKPGGEHGGGGSQSDEVGAQEAAVFLLAGGRLAGPDRLSTLGVRAVKEQTSVGSSLFAQPLMLQAVPLEAGAAVSAGESPEVRAERVIAGLEERAGGLNAHASEARPGAAGELGDHLSLLRRWYYRPEKQRVGEIFLPHADGSWPVRRILRGAARMALGEPKVMAETQREGLAAAKVKILHEGRAGVERVVPAMGRGKKGRHVPVEGGGLHEAGSTDRRS